jgi:predicted O-methyltransferase YrrM
VLVLGSTLGAFAAGAAATCVAVDAAAAETTRAALRAAGLDAGHVTTWGEHRHVDTAPYDLVLHDLGDMRMRTATLVHALRAADPAGFVLLDDAHKPVYAAELDRRLARLCADDYPEAAALTRDALGRHARLVGRVLGPGG